MSLVSDASSHRMNGALAKVERMSRPYGRRLLEACFQLRMQADPSISRLSKPVLFSPDHLTLREAAAQKDAFAKRLRRGGIVRVEYTKN